MTPTTTTTTSRRRRRALVAGGAVVVVATLGVVVGVAVRPDPTGADVPAVAAAGTPASAVCGVADPSRYTALDAATNDLPPVVTPLVADLGEQTPSQLAVSDDAVVALSATDEAATVTRYARDGGAELGSFALPTGAGGRTPGSLVALDDLVVLPAGDDVVAYREDGTEAWRTGLDDLDRGTVDGVLPWTAGVDGAAFAVVLADGDEVALLGADGAVVETDGPAVVPGVPSVLADGSLVVRTEPEQGEIVMRQYAADGTAAGEFAGTAEGDGANGRAALMERPVAVVTAPDGGYLVWGPRTRLVETDAHGVWRRIVISGLGQGPGAVAIADLSPMVRAGDDYYFLSASEDGTALATVDVDGMRTVLEAPVTWDLATAYGTDRLGYGAGLETAAAYDYFADGETPVVTARFAGWWSQVADDYEVRYRVTGDPTLDAGSTSGTVAVPAGGTVDLELPAARPGGYDVHAELLEKATGEVRTATCLRYAVGAPGDDLDPASLSGDADWGGAGPLRGVELADRLGFGVHRVQLDLSRVIPDVDAAPSADALDLTALPGAEDGDPFAGIAAAASLAEESGVELYVQLGQGGDSESRAVEAGTWGAWVGVLAEAFRDGAPDLHTWAAWNEPNNTGFGDGGDYATRVLAPFAAAVRAADPDAVIVDGNALNVVVPWYRQLLEAGACTDVDVLGIHPYTGFNRSWDEEGTDGPLGQIAELRDVMTEVCGEVLPMWDTESGWWVDGPANQWAQAQDVARSMLYLRSLGVSEWMYFYSEGGWGEGNFSWALLQADAFVAPGALAMTTVSGLLEGRPDPVVVDTADVPHVHAVSVGPAEGGDDDLWAVWTDDLATTVTVTAGGAAAATVTDLYGATSDLDLPAGDAVELAVSGSPTYLTVPAGTDLALASGELTGPDLLLGGSVTASSSRDGADPAVLVTPEGAQASPWAAGAQAGTSPDVSPWVAVELAEPAEIDRVVVTSAGIRCCTSGLRTYAVSVQGEDGEWTEVGTADDVFAQRTSTVTFDAVTATAVRIRVPSTEMRGVTVPDVAYSGQNGGLPPAWEPIQTAPTWPLQLLSVSAYGPS